MNASELQQPNAEDAEKTAKAQKLVENDCSHAIIGAAVEVQRVLGIGLLESAYCGALAIEFSARGLPFEREVPVTGSYKGVDLGVMYRADFIVDNSIIVEVKALEAVTEAHRAQLLSYLRVSGHRLGLLINFHGFPVVKAVHRVVNKL